ncbi:MAG TPA: (d)CMP kinase, partial [Patescibacteria group bacterium]|nr:(d)CMP kinase [Patescibacteria group bacterium]
DCKIFLTADVNERAERRFQQSLARGEDVTYEEVLGDTKERDKMDENREFYPLVRDPREYGYIIVDNTQLDEEETLQIIVDELRKRRLLSD